MTPLALERAGALSWVSASPSAFRVLVPPRPMTGAEVMAEKAWVRALMDGSMFGFCEGEVQNYATFNCARMDYAAIDPKTGATSLGRYPTRGATICVRDGIANVVGGADLGVIGGEVVWQGYPAIIENGAVTASTTRDTDRTERAAVGVTFDGREQRIVFFSGIGSMHGFAVACQAVMPSLVWLIYTDGGQSRVLAVRDASGTVTADDSTNLVARRVASFVCFANPLTSALEVKLP